MARLAEKIEQRRHEIDVAYRLRDHFRARLPRQSNQPRNARGFLKHCLLPEEMVRAEAVAMVARVNNDRVVSQAESFQTRQNCADALIDQRHQPEIPLFDAAVFVRRNSKEQLSGKPFTIEERFGLLPFAHQTIAQWDIVTLLERGG
jgi:hypothetical protein